MWINENTLKTYQRHDQIRSDSGDSLPEILTDAVLASINIYPVKLVDPTYDRVTQTAIVLTPSFQNGEWVQQWQITEASAEEIEQRKEFIRQQNKDAVSKLLDETDWVENPSVSDPNRSPHLLNFEDIMNYRMELRRIAINPPEISILTSLPSKPENQWSE